MPLEYLDTADKRLKARVALVAWVGLAANIFGMALQSSLHPDEAVSTFVSGGMITAIALGVLWSTRRDWHVRRVALFGIYGVTGVLLWFIALRGGLTSYYAPAVAILPGLSVLVFGSRDVLIHGLFLAALMALLFVLDGTIERPDLAPRQDLLASTALLGTVVLCNVLVLFYIARESEARLRRLSDVLADQVHAATHDALTGLANRSAVQSRLELAETEGHRIMLSLIDLDGFKQVNDRHGHATGDRMLVSVTERLRERVPEAQMIARLGGDEFLLIHAQSDDPGDLGDRLNSGPRLAHKGSVVTFSIGSALFPQDAPRTRDVLARADRALYHAKAAGKARHIRHEGAEDPPAPLVAVGDVP